MGQKTQHGYSFMLQSFMRPTMLVFGFVVASLVVDAMGYFLTHMYPMVIANVQMNSITGFFSILGFIAIFFVLVTGVINSAFSAVYSVPDSIFAFMGIQQSNTGFGRDLGQHAASGIKTGTGIASVGGTGNSMWGGGGDPYGSARNAMNGGKGKNGGGAGVGPGQG